MQHVSSNSAEKLCADTYRIIVGRRFPCQESTEHPGNQKGRPILALCCQGPELWGKIYLSRGWILMPMLLQTGSGPATATTESSANLSLENRAGKCLCAAKTPTEMQTISLSAANRKHKMQKKETAMKPIYQLLTDNDDDATNRACMYFLENARWVQQCAMDSDAGCNK
jgi:hypothetical protein